MFKLNIKDVVNSSVNDVNMTDISDTNDASASIVNNNDVINKIPTSSYYFDSSLLWHARLGHVYFKRMRNRANANLIPKLDSKNHKCQTCMHTKITRLSFPTIQRSSKTLKLVHSDVCDLHATPTIGGKKYFATFIDDYSRYCYFYLLHSKDEVLEKFRIYKSEVELKCDTRIKCLWTDRGGEYYDPRYFQSTEIPITTKGNNDDSFSDHQQVEPRRSTRQRRQRTFGPDIEMYLVEGDRKEAVNDEMDSIIGNNTWILVDLPPGSKAIKTLASINKLIIHQMDVKTTFLNDELEEEVYMEQPEEQVQMTKKLLSENFDMKDSGEADFILGIKILRKENRLITQFEVGSKLTYNTSRILAQNKYAKVIGILMYAMTCTRPDIAYAVGRLSRHTSSLGKEQWDARVFTYLKKTMDYGLEYNGDPSVLEGYTNASWITDQADYASISGWIFTLGRGAVS
ncbi:zinc finger, CCHC-type containing protein [Tanacetum coccineum]